MKRGWLWLGILVCLLVATACGAAPKPEPEVRSVTVSVPVLRSCVPADLGPEPAYVDTDEAIRSAPGPADRYQLAVAGRLQRKARAAEVEPVIRGCR